MVAYADSVGRYSTCFRIAAAQERLQCWVEVEAKMPILTVVRSQPCRMARGVSESSALFRKRRRAENDSIGENDSIAVLNRLEREAIQTVCRRNSSAGAQDEMPR